MYLLDLLGFRRPITGFTMEYGNTSICASSKRADVVNNAFNGCSGKVSYPEAKQFCEAVGARLCTLPELQADETQCVTDEITFLCPTSVTVCVCVCVCVDGPCGVPTTLPELEAYETPCVNDVLPLYHCVGMDLAVFPSPPLADNFIDRMTVLRAVRVDPTP
jgi:hypothetical protein